MRTTPLFLLLSLALVGCSSAGQATLDQHLQNPLFAEQYWGDYAQRLADIEIYKDLPHNKEIVEDTKRLASLRSLKEEALSKHRAATKTRDRAATAMMTTLSELSQGEVMLVDNVLYTDPLFDTPPGPDLHMYVSEITDPRDVEFPDPTAIDLGVVYQPYGAGAYPIPERPSDAKRLYTVILYDKELKRLYAFAQLQLGPDAGN